jgi:spore coat polysaccharide biosynthesis protein SpsF
MGSSLKVVTVIQTRTGSSRFPSKTLKLLGGRPIFLRLVERVKAAKYSGTVVVATTFLAEDDIIESLCRGLGIDCFRGHPTDLLDRHYQAAITYNADAIVKIPSDCPLVDIAVIDEVIGLYLQNPKRYDYVSNLHPATFPDGNDVEIMCIDVLHKAWLEAERDFEREHTTPYIWENPHMFRLANVVYPHGDFSMTHRWCLDYPEDYLLIKALFDELYPKNPFFGISEILKVLQEKPYLREINERYRGVNWYRHHLKELKTISPKETVCLI